MFGRSPLCFFCAVEEREKYIYIKTFEILFASFFPPSNNYFFVCQSRRSVFTFFPPTFFPFLYVVIIALAHLLRILFFSSASSILTINYRETLILIRQISVPYPSKKKEKKTYLYLLKICLTRKRKQQVNNTFMKTNTRH